MTESAMPNSGSPILIIGICRRSGTNFLAKLLLCHRDCGKPRPPLAEDYLLKEAGLLKKYTKRTARQWKRTWGDREAGQASLERHLGSGLISFLQQDVEKPRVVSKTPCADNLSLYPELFPNAHIVILLRDGRSVTESLVRGFEWTYERAVREWRRGARAIIDVQESMQRKDTNPNLHVLIVRYEDLFNKFDAELARILDFLQLDPARFDLDAARDLPIVGSSYTRDENGKFTYRATEKSQEFNPLQRFESWLRWRHERFNWLAGVEQRTLGYDLTKHSTGHVKWTLYNYLYCILVPAILARDALKIMRNRYQQRK